MHKPLIALFLFIFPVASFGADLASPQQAMDYYTSPANPNGLYAPFQPGYPPKSNYGPAPRYDIADAKKCMDGGDHSWFFNPTAKYKLFLGTCFEKK